MLFGLHYVRLTFELSLILPLRCFAEYNKYTRWLISGEKISQPKSYSIQTVDILESQLAEMFGYFSPCLPALNHYSNQEST